MLKIISEKALHQLWHITKPKYFPQNNKLHLRVVTSRSLQSNPQSHPASWVPSSRLWYSDGTTGRCRRKQDRVIVEAKVRSG